MHCLPLHMIDCAFYCSCSAADVNRLKVPDELDDKRVVLLSDTLTRRLAWCQAGSLEGQCHTCYRRAFMHPATQVLHPPVQRM